MEGGEYMREGFHPFPHFALIQHISPFVNDDGGTNGSLFLLFANFLQFFSLSIAA
jgi:hypothetical protein